MTVKTVVTSATRPSKAGFHAKLMMGIARAQNRLGGVGAVADKLDMTTQALGKVFSGSMPCAHRQGALIEHIAALRSPTVAA